MANAHRSSLYSESNASEMEDSPNDEVLIGQKTDPGAAVVHDDLFERFSLNGVSRKVLFLKNSQAEMIAENPESLSKLVDMFCLSPPKLVINLCMSKGFREHLDAVHDFKQDDISPGTIKGRAPFRSGNATIKVDFAENWMYKLRTVQNYYCKDPNVRVSLKNCRDKSASMFGDVPLSKERQPLAKDLERMKFRIEGSTVQKSKSQKTLELALDFELKTPFWKNLRRLKKMQNMIESVLPQGAIKKTFLVSKKHDICIEDPVPRREQHFPLEVVFRKGDAHATKLMIYTQDWLEEFESWLHKQSEPETQTGTDRAGQADASSATCADPEGPEATSQAYYIDWEKVDVKNRRFAKVAKASESSSSQKSRFTVQRPSTHGSATADSQPADRPPEIPAGRYQVIFELGKLEKPEKPDRGPVRGPNVPIFEMNIKEPPHYVEFRRARDWDWKEMVLLADVLRAGGGNLRPATAEAQRWYLPSKEEFPLHIQVSGVSRKEEKECEDLLENFVSNTLLPLAAKTNALIFCTALSPICALTQVLFRVVSTKQQAFGKDMPFTILCTTANMFHLYASETFQKKDSQRKDGSKCFWHGIRKGSVGSWKKRDKIIQETIDRHSSKDSLPQISFDLQSAARNFLLVDSLGVVGQEEFGVENKYMLETYEPYNKLIRNLTKHLWKTVPVFAVKTGGGDRITLQNIGKGTEASTLQSSLELLHAQVPVLWVDVRRRIFTKATEYRLYGFSRGIKEGDMHIDEVIKEAKAGFTGDTDLLLWEKEKLADTFDACAIAYFLRVFQSIRAASATRELRLKEVELEMRLEQEKEDEQGTTCYSRMVEMCTSCMPTTSAQSSREDDADSDESNNDMLDRQQDDQEMESKTNIARWLAEKMFDHAAKVNESGESCDYEKHVDAMAHWVREILMSDHSFNINLHDGKGLQDDEVTKLAMLSRLPEENGRKGDKLLAEAWLDYDIAMMLADRYKLYTNLLFLSQAFLGLLTIGLSGYASSVENQADIPEWRNYERSNQGLFGLALLGSALISIEALLKARIRWRQLRAHACTMKKTIWCYRTRVGPFELIHGESSIKSPEAVLVEVLNEWRQSVMNSANLADTAFEQKYRNRTFKHTIGQSSKNGCGICSCRCLQRSRKDDMLLKEEERTAKSDWYAPVEPRKYIKQRLEKAQQFYTKRIPGYVGWSSFWQAFTIILGIVASGLAYFGQQAWLVVVVAFSTSCLSWVEFRDHTRKTARYTHVALGLRNLMTWWNNLTLVERASAENIRSLVLGSEDLLMTEMNAWISTSNEDKKKGRSNEQSTQAKSKPKDTE